MTTSLPDGILWTSTIRTSTIEASCRQAFIDQIQDQGFKYLDDYFSSILGAVSQDSMIEFVKTPGRKIDKRRKMKAVLNLGVNDGEITNENMYPSRSLSQVHLIKEKKAGLHGFVSQHHPKELLSHQLSNLAEQPEHHQSTDTTEISENALDSYFVQSQASSSVAANSMQDLGHTQGYHTLSFPISTLTTKLSVIQEGAEPAEYSNSLRPISPISANASPLVDLKVSRSHESQVLHNLLPKDGVIRAPGRPSSTISSPGVARVLLNPSSDCVSELSRLPLPVLASSSPLSAPSLMSMSSISATSTSQPLMPQSVLPFPSLPAPSPLRKSVRGRDTSTSLAELPLGITVPALGKRTSWLMKAREVKAMENIVAKQTPLENDAHGANGTTTQTTINIRSKLKSEEAFDILASDNVDQDQDGSEHRLKAIKAHFFNTIASKLDGEVNSIHTGEGSLNTVGDATTAATLAEARAAAETRVAERNKLHEDMTITSTNSTQHNNFLPHSFTTTPPPAKRSAQSISLPHGSQHLYSYYSVHDQAAEVEEADSSKQKKELLPLHKTPSRAKQCIAEGGLGYEGTWLYSPTRRTAVEHDTALHQPLSSVVLTPEASEQILLPVKDDHIGLPIAAAYSLPGQLLHGAPDRTSSPPRILQVESEIYRTTLPAQPHCPLFDAHHETITPRWQKHDISLTQIRLSFDERDNGLEDESLPVEDRLARSQEVWMPFNFDRKDNSMAWSTLPTEPLPGDPGIIKDDVCAMWGGKALDEDGSTNSTPHPFNVQGSGGDQSNYSDIAGEIGLAIPDLQKPDCAARGAIALDRVENLESISINQSRAQFSNQTSKVVDSTLSGSRKGRHELKSLQLAAVAAKRQQEEQDKKTVRLKEMENRRIQAQQRKILEDRAHALEQEKKMKEDSEKRKREKDEQSDRKLFKNTVTKKMDQGAIKKRKIDVDIAKKQVKKPLPKDDLSSSELGVVISTRAEPHLNSGQVTGVAECGSLTKLAPVVTGESSQMQATEESPEPVILSENIELPDVNSEYSDSDDEDRPCTFNLPEWAHSPELNEALQVQSRLNPDDVFGVIRPLRMEEMFRTRQSRFRARTSSANWFGTDKLTLDEEKEYARRMGFR